MGGWEAVRWCVGSKVVHGWPVVRWEGEGGEEARGGGGLGKS